MLVLAIWLFAVLGGVATWWARKQGKEVKQLAEKLTQTEQRAEQLAGYVQRALEDVYVLSVLMAERGHLDPDEIERGRERLIKNAKQAQPRPQQPDARVPPRGTVH